uniref:Uncharacterized protein n=1 Tax=Lepeophtheirus salmonis TaxID=72036 RepID=A0A0K2UL60_LEPSM
MKHILNQRGLNYHFQNFSSLCTNSESIEHDVDQEIQSESIQSFVRFFLS